MEICNICGASAKFLFTKKILHKYDVKYYQCSECGFHFTEKPYWLNEAYSDVIAKTDTGLVARNLSISKKLAPILFFLTKKNDKCVDISGGYGLFVRLMRDIGFDYYWEDEFCENILAQGFEANDEHYKLATAFEVLEHLENPYELLSNKLKKYNFDILITSTSLYRKSLPKQNWDYYSLETGQHISFYKSKTIKALANRLGMKALVIGNFQIFYKVRSTRLKIFLALLILPLLKILYPKRMKNRTYPDYQMMKERLL